MFFKCCFAAILKSHVKPVANMIAHRLRNGDASRLCHAFETCRDIDAVAVDVVAFDNDVAEVYRRCEIGCALSAMFASRIAV